jgi:hypothetical protein
MIFEEKFFNLCSLRTLKDALKRFRTGINLRMLRDAVESLDPLERMMDTRGAVTAQKR